MNKQNKKAHVYGEQNGCYQRGGDWGDGEMGKRE